MCLSATCTSSYLWALMRYENADELRVVMRAGGVLSCAFVTCYNTGCMCYVYPCLVSLCCATHVIILTCQISQAVARRLKNDSTWGLLSSLSAPDLKTMHSPRPRYQRNETRRDAMSKRRFLRPAGSGRQGRYETNSVHYCMYVQIGGRIRFLLWSRGRGRDMQEPTKPQWNHGLRAAELWNQPTRWRWAFVLLVAARGPRLPIEGGVPAEVTSSLPPPPSTQAQTHCERQLLGGAERSGVRLSCRCVLGQPKQTTL